MARKTAAELRAQREENTRLMETQLWAEFVSSYPARLMHLMYEFTTNPRGKFTVKRSEEPNTYVLKSYQDWTQDFVFPAVPPAEYNFDLLNDLEAAESALLRAELEEQEAKRKLAVREAALAKLSNEERQELQKMFRDELS